MMIEDVEADLRDALTDRASQVPPEAVQRIRAVDYRPRAALVRPRLAVGALAGSFAAAAAAIAVFTLGAGAPAAFAGWTRSPSHAARAQVASATGDCAKQLTTMPAGPGSAPPTTVPGGATPVLTDSRGPFTFVIYAGNGFIATCATGPGFESVSASQGTNVGVAPAGQVVLSSQHLTTRGGHPYTLVEGHAGAGVTGTTLLLDDGTKVTASLANGWFAAWWPGSQDVTAAEVTTSSGTKTQPLPPQPGPPPPCKTGRCTQSGGFSSVGSPGGSGSGRGYMSTGSSSMQK
jgi:hypothetical protein